MTAESELEDGVELRSALLGVRSDEIAVKWNVLGLRGFAMR